MPADAANIGIATATGPGADVQGISRLLIRFSEAVDSRRPADIAALFSADGLFKPGDKAIVGPAAIESFYRERLADPRRTTRHLWSNLLVGPAGADGARIQVVLTNYAFEPAVSETDVQMRLGDVTGRCVQDAGGEWLFAEHLYQRLYALRLPRA